MDKQYNGSYIQKVILSEDKYLQVARLRCYYHGITEPEDRGPFTGRHFDSFASRDRQINEFTAADFYAVSALSVTVPTKAGFPILDRNGDVDFGYFLGQVPDVNIEDISSRDEFEELLGDDSAATTLWDLLCRNNKGDKKWNIGSTTASKLMHRKRPGLIPIYDSVIRNVLQDKTKSNWQHWWEALAGDRGAELRARASSLREAIGKENELSLLRVLDVVLWMDPEFNSKREAWDKDIREHAKTQACG